MLKIRGFQASGHAVFLVGNQSFSGHPDCFWLVDINPRHQPVELLPREAANLGLISGPTVVSLGGQPFVDQDNAIWLFHDCFDPVTPAATEQEKSMADVHGELLLYDCTEPIDRLAHVGPSTGNVDCVYSRDVG